MGALIIIVVALAGIAGYILGYINRGIRETKVTKDTIQNAWNDGYWKGIEEQHERRK